MQIFWLEKSKFPDCLKLANVTPVSKRVHVRQKMIIDQLAFCQFCLNYSNDWLAFAFRVFWKLLSKFQCGFRKGHGAQDCLLMMLETWKEAADNSKAFGALLTDLSKAFDCLSHDVLIAKLHACGLDLASLKIL